MLQFVLRYLYCIICAVSSFSFIYMSNLFQKKVKLQANQDVNSRFSFTDPKKSLFVDLLYIIQLLSVSYD